ncbi:MAG TPA: glycosyltransferase, partial [Dehalococcoidales bacterium]|nr:glycosyltransferase [Dehalococcoidales bacterium]
MKILYVFDFFSPQGGGTVNLLHSLSRALVQRGHEVSIYTTDLKLDEDYIASAPGVKIYPFHCISSLGRFYLTPSLMRTARENLRHFDIIHLQCFRSFQNIVIYYYARKYGVPYVIEHHGSLPRKVPGETNLKWLLRWLFDVIIGYRILNGAARIVLVNEFGVREYEAFGATNREIAVIPHYFNVEDFNNIPQRGQFRERFNLNGKKILLFLGRIHRIKGLDFLVASLHELSRLRPDVVLVIAGQDDGYQAALEELIRALNLSGQVVFTGFLSGQDKLAALVDADLLVLTS